MKKIVFMDTYPIYAPSLKKRFLDSIKIVIVVFHEEK